MGAYQQIYLGPYLVAKHKTVNITIPRRACDNSECEKYNLKTESNYCPGCGHPTKVTNIPAWRSYTAEEKLPDEMRDEVYWPHAGGTSMYRDRQLMLPNSSKGRPQKWEIDGNQSMDYPLNHDPKDNAEDIDWFKQKYAGVIDILTRELGPESITIEWGLVIHYS